MAAPRVAIGPGGPADWAVRSVEDGGGRVVPVADAEAVLWTSPARADELADMLDSAPGVRWVQLPWAGVERFASRGLFADGRTWTCAKGAYAEPVAEHALALALAGLRDLPGRARASSWGAQGGRSLHRGRVTIVGGGGITRALLRLLAPFDAEVTVVRRHDVAVDGAARVVTADRLHDALPGADVVVLALPLTPETEGLIGAAELALMEPWAWLVNVARGAHVVTDELVAALEAGIIGGAALDVVEPEPLPDGHPLWGLPGCLITPHTANSAEMAAPVLAALVGENLARFTSGRPLLGLVDAELGY